MNPIDEVSIRPYQATDTDAHFAAVRESIDELSRWMSWCQPDYAFDRSLIWVSTQVMLFEKQLEYGFVVVDRTDRFLGACSLNHLEAAERRANLGYWIRTSARGQGIAPRAVRRLVNWAFAHTTLERIEILAAADNRASQRVAEKSGAQFEGLLRRRIRLKEQMHDARLYSFIRP